MTIAEVLAQLESMSDEARRRHTAKVGPDGTAPAASQFGVKLGDIRTLAKKLKPPAPVNTFARALWETGNLEAQLLAALLFTPADLPAPDLDAMIRTTSCAQAAEWINSYVVSQHPEKDALRIKWMKDKNPWAARAGWHLTASLINKGAAEAPDPAALLDRIERELPKARPEVQWTMNNTLAAIGIRHAALRARATAIGQRTGLYQDWPVSKGCTPPYVPVWIAEMVRRQK